MQNCKRARVIFLHLQARLVCAYLEFMHTLILEFYLIMQFACFFYKLMMSETLMRLIMFPHQISFKFLFKTFQLHPHDISVHTFFINEQWNSRCSLLLFSRMQSFTGSKVVKHFHS